MSITRFAPRTNTTRENTATIERGGVVPFAREKAKVIPVAIAKVVPQVKVEIAACFLKESVTPISESPLGETSEEVATTETSDTEPQNRKVRRKVR
jgi:hypothetical protein